MIVCVFDLSGSISGSPHVSGSTFVKLFCGVVF